MLNYIRSSNKKNHRKQGYLYREDMFLHLFNFKSTWVPTSNSYIIFFIILIYTY